MGGGVASPAMRVWVHDREFVCSLRGDAWQAADALLAVDGTVEIEARSVHQDGPDVLGLIHGRLVRPSLDTAFTVPLSLEEIGQLVRDAQASAGEAAFDAQASDRERVRIRAPDARFRIPGCRIPVTAAPTYPGDAWDVLESRFALGSADWMQDWPLEVSDPERVEAFTSFYDEVDDPAVRFDVMQLALFSYEERVESRSLSGVRGSRLSALGAGVRLPHLRHAARHLGSLAVACGGRARGSAHLARA